METLKIIESKKIHRLTAAKITKTKIDNTITEIRKAIAELTAENLKPSQANVIRKLKGKRCKKTIIQHWKSLFPKHSSEDTVYDLPDHANQKPLNQWTNTEFGVPTLEQERNYYPEKNVNLLIYHLQCMRQFRIQELQRVGRY